MDYRRLGSSGMRVSRLCLGCMSYGGTKERPWALEEAESDIFFRRSIEAGINFFDTADTYGTGASEEITGRMLKRFAKRHEVVLATKVYNPMGPGPNDRGLSRKHIMEGIDASLRRLGVDYVDLYQIHRFDPNTPVEETMAALHDVVRAGKALYIGASSMYAWQFAKLQHAAERNGFTRFVAMQNHYNLVYREEEREMIPLCTDQGIGLIPWSPIARGFLAGNRRRQDWGETTRSKTDPIAQRLYYTDDDFAVVDAVAGVAKARGVSMARVAYAWILAKPAVTAPIIGVTKPEQLEDALAATELVLTEAEVAAMEAPYKPHPILGHQ
jgi:aryl-alcohol dehydrogenase-like predicted oxidoreductase